MTNSKKEISCMKVLFPQTEPFRPDMFLDDKPVMVRTGFIKVNDFNLLGIDKGSNVESKTSSLTLVGLAVGKKRGIKRIVTLSDDIVKQTNEDSPNDLRWGVRNEIAMQLFQDGEGKLPKHKKNK